MNKELMTFNISVVVVFETSCFITLYRGKWRERLIASGAAKHTSGILLGLSKKKVVFPVASEKWPRA